MESNALSRMDRHIEAIQDLFHDNITEFPSWYNVFGEIPEDAEIQDFREVVEILNDFPEPANALFHEIQNNRPTIEETPTILAYLYKEIRGLQIPPVFYDFEKGPVLDWFRERFPLLRNNADFDNLCYSICVGLYTIVFNFEYFYREYDNILPGKENTPIYDIDNPIRRAFPLCFPAVEAAADTPPEIGRTAIVSEAAPAGQYGGSQGQPAAAGSAERIYIPTHYSRSQLERLYRGLVDGGFVEDSREQDFLLCFEPGADKPQGRFVWTARGEKNREQIVIHAACDLFDLLGIQEDFGKYVEALCENIPTFTKSARRKARGRSRYYFKLETILKSIENQ